MTSGNTNASSDIDYKTVIDVLYNFILEAHVKRFGTYRRFFSSFAQVNKFKMAQKVVCKTSNPPLGTYSIVKNKNRKKNFISNHFARDE